MDDKGTGCKKCGWITESDEWREGKKTHEEKEEVKRKEDEKKRVKKGKGVKEENNTFF